MTENDVIVVLGNAPEFPQEIVEQAVSEALSGQHGEFLQKVCEEIAKEWGLDALS